MTEIIRPSIDENNNTITPDGIVIENCSLSDNGDIIGYTSDGKKALYKSFKDKWFIGGDEIKKANLINLRERTKDERLEIIEKANEAKRKNIEQKKNIEELAKIILERSMSDNMINDILGDKADLLPDNSVASVLVGAMVKSALEGSFKAFEAVRDTAGYKPKNELEIQADIMTESDKMLIDKVSKVG